MSYQPHLFPVSVKGVVVRDGRVLLLRNERDEWELPGGKLELGEEPAVRNPGDPRRGRLGGELWPTAGRLAVPHPRRH